MAMNEYQEIWWQQAKSDHSVFVLLRGQGVPPCHSLHYLQMVTEKIAKAYFWRSDSPPPKKHTAFVHFLRSLGAIHPNDRDRIANLFSFRQFIDFQNWIKVVLPIAYDLEQLAPSLANDGPNSEYPWPNSLPQCAPVNYIFPVWKLVQSGNGRDLMRVVHIAVDRFPEYA